MILLNIWVVSSFSGELTSILYLIYLNVKINKLFTHKFKHQKTKELSGSHKITYRVMSDCHLWHSMNCYPQTTEPDIPCIWLLYLYCAYGNAEFLNMTVDINSALCFGKINDLIVFVFLGSWWKCSLSVLMRELTWSLFLSVLTLLLTKEMCNLSVKVNILRFYCFGGDDKILII